MSTKLIRLQAQLLANLSEHQNDSSNATIANAIFIFTEEGLETLKTYAAEIPFENVADYELYYHVVFPLFASAYQYFGKVCWALEVKTLYDSDTYRDFVLEEIDLVTKFLKYHLQYSHYSALEFVDRPFASTTPPMNSSQKKTAKPQTVANQLQFFFHSPTVKAHVDYKIFLEKEKIGLEGAPAFASGKIYEFVGSQADAMENIEGWTETKVIKVNGQFATLREVAEMWTSWFRKPIPNIYSKRRFNQDRKKEKAPFMNRMAQALRESASRPRQKRV